MGLSQVSRTMVALTSKTMQQKHPTKHPTPPAMFLSPSKARVNSCWTKVQGGHQWRSHGGGLAGLVNDTPNGVAGVFCVLYFEGTIGRLQRVQNIGSIGVLFGCVGGKIEALVYLVVYSSTRAIDLPQKATYDWKAALSSFFEGTTWDKLDEG